MALGVSRILSTMLFGLSAMACRNYGGRNHLLSTKARGRLAPPTCAA